MARTKNKIKFKIKVVPRTSERDLETSFEELNDNIRKQLEILYRKTFGKETSLQDWVGGNRSAVSKKLSNARSTRVKQNPLSLDKLLQAYSSAWKNKYKKIIADYKAADSGYKERKWHKWKKDNLRKKAPVHRPGTKVRFTTWGLTTGYLRESIDRGFNQGGNQNLEVSNLLLQGGFSVNWENYQQTKGGEAHYVLFIKHLISIGVLDSQDDFLDFAESDWKKIASFMFFFVKNNFVDQFQEALSEAVSIVRA